MYPSDRKRPSTAQDEVHERRKSGCYPRRTRLTAGAAVGGKGLDRYIPQVASKKAYRASPSLKKFDVRDPELMERSPSPERLSSPGFFNDLRSTGHYEAITGRERIGDSTSVTEPSVSGVVSTTTVGTETPNLSFEQKRHREYIADSLGFQSPQRVFQFAGCVSKSRNDHSGGSSKLQSVHGSVAQHHHYLTVDPLTTALPPSKAMAHLATTAFSGMSQSRSFVSDEGAKRPAKRLKSHIPYRVLDAPCLRNDFYSNLISWSKSTDNIMVGLGCSVYMWSDKHGAVPVLSHDYLNRKHDIVTCVSFCPQNALFVVGTKQGRVLLFDQDVCLKRRRLEGEALKPLCEYQSTTLRGISCVQWLHRGKGTNLLVGEECGDVSYLAVKETLRLLDTNFAGQNESESRRGQATQLLDYAEEYQNFKLQFISRFQAQSQQVCGTFLSNTLAPKLGRILTVITLKGYL
ncbi:hypothetical protein HG536_0A01270 [Torulaspora globosa]|uniref:Anaphase-promoting complex subunit 4 WD40 domain-containing protein n=1 Tax=Torulaspora globosa TaxID=48254 RepID=A0A7G3Z9X4_9SACH|nr:uncharacterized protein HG536_0A01270 [Torulaspora globosa]QLL30310.1 hypothetical protein HG536_0A01270 [Torulaspora globosa]